MAILELGIDASKMQGGAQSAQSALNAVAEFARRTVDRMNDVEKSFQQFGTTFQRNSGSGLFLPGREVREYTEQAAKANTTTATFAKQIGVAGEALQITGRVQLLSREIGELSNGMGSASVASLLFAQGLLDVAQIVEKTNKATAEGGGFFAKLIGSIRANPILTAVAAIGALGAAISLFGSNTRTATKEQDLFNEAVRKAQDLQRDQAFNEKIGFSGGAQSIEDQIAQLRQVANGLRNRDPRVKDDRTFDASAVGDLVGRRDTFRIAEGLGAGRRQEIGGPIEQLFGAPNSDKFVFTADEVAKILEERAKELAKLVPNGGRDNTLRPGNAEFLQLQQIRADAGIQIQDYVASLQKETEFQRLSNEEREKAVAVYQAENVAKQAGIPLDEAAKNSIREQIGLQQQLTQLRQLGADVGQAIGQGLITAANSAHNLRQALVAVAQQLASLAQSRAIQGLSNAFGSAFAATGAQAGQAVGAGGDRSLRAGT